jgi:hypothetical protein
VENSTSFLVLKAGLADKVGFRLGDLPDSHLSLDKRDIFLLCSLGQGSHIVSARLCEHLTTTYSGRPKTR